jgi:hypothetical protein
MRAPGGLTPLHRAIKYALASLDRLCVTGRNVFLLFHAIEQIDAHRKGEIDGASVLIFIPGKCLDAGGCARTVADETIKSRPARNQEKTDESSRPL